MFVLLLGYVDVCLFCLMIVMWLFCCICLVIKALPVGFGCFVFIVDFVLVW